MDILYHTYASAALAPTKKGSRASFLPHWFSGKDTALDVTVAKPLKQELFQNEKTLQKQSKSVIPALNC